VFGLSEKVQRAVSADGPSFLNVLTDFPVGWGHEPRSGPRILDAAVESRFWPLYEVVDGGYRLTYEPQRGRLRSRTCWRTRSRSRTCSARRTERLST
jgi:pyruvate ferredoxin oxidoreductase beta subunit